MRSPGPSCAEPGYGSAIVRAKRTLSEKQVPSRFRAGTNSPGRLSSVLEVIYLIFNEGTRRPPQ